jgi:putative transposase
MRKPRLFFAGGLYHIIARGNQGHPTFLDKADYARYLRLLGEPMEGRGVKAYSYCLMPNHVHLLLEQSGNYPLSKFMQRLQTAYTLYFNRRHKKNGHLFQGRYKAILVERDAYLKDLVRYLQLNPVRSKLVEDPAEYPWTGFRQYVGTVKDPVVKLDVEEVLSGFGPDPREARKAYKQYVLDAMKEGHRKDLYHLRKGHILGSHEFEKKAHECAAVPAGEPSLKIEKSVPEIWTALLHREGHSDPKGRKRSDLLAEAAFLATEGGCATQREVGEHFGLKQSGVSRALRRLERKWSEEPHLKEKTLNWARGLEKV